MQKFLQFFNLRSTPQSQPIPGSTQVPNSAGGFAWELDIWGKLDRFLVLGTEGGTFYVKEGALTLENADAVGKCIDADGLRVVNRVVEISMAGRAAKNDPALFVLAMAAALGEPEVRKAALDALPAVARTGTHLFHFLQYVEGMRGWGRGLRRAVGAWYTAKPADQLALQLVKYQQRDGWSHRDALRLAHPTPPTDQHATLYRWAVGKSETPTIEGSGVALLDAYVRVQAATSESQVIDAIVTNKLPREAIPTEWLTKPAVWEALLQDMPMEAMVRNLATMTRVGLLAPGSHASKLVAERLRDGERIRKARLHPVKLLAALITYQNGRGARSKGDGWTPVTGIVDALDAAFYLAFGNVEPSGKRLVFGLDVSGSMFGGMVSGVKLVPLTISPRQRLDDVVKTMNKIPFGGTDCALPMLWALERKVKADAFVILTDSETWFGQIHPAQALRQYRERMGIDAKLVVCGMVANRFTIADPNDAGMLDVVGFDTAVPQLISDFAAGR